MVPVVLHHDAAGAPALTGEAGSLIAILKWALPQLGWTLEFEDTVNNRAAFRNSPAVGSGYYLRVRDNAADHTFDNYVAAVEGFSSMTDVDTGLDGFPAATDNFFLKSPTLDATVREYTIIGTDTFFWWLPNFPTLIEGHRIFGAGDYLPFDQADTTNFCIIGKESTSASAPGLYSGIEEVSTASTSVGGDIHIAFKRDGSVDQDVIPLAAPNGNERGWHMGHDGVYPDPYTGSINTSRVFLGDRAENSAYVGLLPGLLAPMGNLRAGNQTDFANRQMVPAINNGKTLTDVLFLFRNISFGWTSDASLRGGAVFFDVLTDWADW